MKNPGAATVLLESMAAIIVPSPRSPLLDLVARSVEMMQSMKTVSVAATVNISIIKTVKPR